MADGESAGLTRQELAIVANWQADYDRWMKMVDVFAARVGLDREQAIRFLTWVYLGILVNDFGQATKGKTEPWEK